jgi:hypothetical protein
VPEEYRRGELIVPLTPMRFELARDDGRFAVYEALRRDYDEPEEPLYSLTVTVPSPGDNVNAREELEHWLGEMLVGYKLTEPSPEDDRPQTPEPDLDIDPTVVFEFRLVEARTPDRALGVTVVARTTVPEPSSAHLRDDEVRVQVERLNDEAGAEVAQAREIVSGVPHEWRAKGGLKRNATVTARGGAGEVRNPYKSITVGGGSKVVKGTRVWVSKAAGQTSCTYDFEGSANFRGPFT